MLADKFNQQLFDVLIRSRNVSSQRRQSKAASMTLSMKEWAEKQRQDAKCANTIRQIIRNSKAASVQANGINQAQVIHNFLNSKH
jgi:hypothetical protein